MKKKQLNIPAIRKKHRTFLLNLFVDKAQCTRKLYTQGIHINKRFIRAQIVV
jgi:hypothetical protein